MPNKARLLGSGTGTICAKPVSTAMSPPPESENPIAVDNVVQTPIGPGIGPAV